MNASRRRAPRSRYARAVTLVLVLAAAVGSYLVVLSGLGQVAFGAFLVNNDVTATRAATAMTAAGAFERYRGPFAEGTVLAAHAQDTADLADAEELLREALELADPAGECVVRYNLALVLEAAAQQVERSEQPDAAELAEAGYREAAAMAEAAPAGCAEVPSGHDAGAPAAQAPEEGEQKSAADDLADTAERASAAAEAAAADAEEAAEDGEGDSGDEPADDESEPAEPRVPSDRQSELEQRMRDAYQTQQRVGGRDGGGEGGAGDGTPQVPAPW